MSEQIEDKVVLITGAAHRVGAAMARKLHANGMRVVIHYRNSRDAAVALQQELNAIRTDSAAIASADLDDMDDIQPLVDTAFSFWNRLDVLINNASMFFPTPMGEVDIKQWDELFSSNLKAPFFLTQAAASHLKAGLGVVINIVDIHADRPLKNYPVYCMAKAGLVMMTKTLAREYGDDIRVNAVAPGAILWPEGIDEQTKQDIVSRTALKRKGDPEDIAKAVLYLVRDATYTTGQVLAVEGGRTLSN